MTYTDEEAKAIQVANLGGKKRQVKNLQMKTKNETINGNFV